MMIDEAIQAMDRVLEQQDDINGKVAEVEGHSHEVAVDKDRLDNEEATELRTSEDDGHFHTLRLSAGQLRKIKAKEKVQAKTSEYEGHTHSVTFGD